MKAITIILGSALITAAALTSLPALAAPASEVVVSRVGTADLDLSSNRGLQTLNRRLVKAARDVCGTASDADLEGKNSVRRCRDETFAKAMLQRDAALAANRSGAIIAVTAAR